MNHDLPRPLENPANHPPARAPRPVWRRLAPWLIAGSLIVFLLSQVPLSSIVDLVLHADLRLVFLGAALYLVINLVRSVRAVVILRSPLRDAPKLIAPNLASSFGSNVLPARAGELVFIWAVHQELNAGWGPSTALLIIMRVFDILAVAICFMATVALGVTVVDARMLALILALLAAGVAVMALLPWIGRYLVQALVRLVGLARREAWTGFVAREGGHATAAFAMLRDGRVYLATLGLSLLIWLLLFGWIFILIRAIGIPTTLEQTVLGATFAVYAKAIPFTSIGGWGAHELGWAAGFSLAGWPIALAISSGFAVNTLIILTSAVCGLPAWMKLTAASRHNARAAPGAASKPIPTAPSDT